MSLEHILLGMLQRPTTGYQLRKEFEGGAAHFWSARLSQIYPALQRMEQNGLLAAHEEKSPKGPPRRVYRRTAKGTRTLHAWLRSEPQVGTARFAYIAQLISMAELNDLDRTREFMLDLRERLSDELHFLTEASQPVFEAFESDPQSLDSTEFHEMISIAMGVKSLTAKVKWCDETLEMIERRKATS